MAADDYVVVRLTTAKESLKECENLIVETFTLISSKWGNVEAAKGQINVISGLFFGGNKINEDNMLNKDTCLSDDVKTNVLKILASAEGIINKVPVDGNFVDQLSNLANEITINMTSFTTPVDSLELVAIQADDLGSAVQLGMIDMGKKDDEVQKIKNDINSFFNKLNIPETSNTKVAGKIQEIQAKLDAAQITIKNIDVKNMITPNSKVSCIMRFVTETEASKPNNELYYYNSKASISGEVEKFKNKTGRTGSIKNIIDYIKNYDMRSTKDKDVLKQITRAIKQEGAAELVNSLVAKPGLPDCILEVIIEKDGNEILGLGKLLLTYNQSRRIVL